MAAGEQVIRAPAQLGVLLKAGGTSQARQTSIEQAEW
jgi:hypothetical protein